MAKSSKYRFMQRAKKVDHSALSAEEELPIQVGSLTPNLQRWVENGHNKGLINEFKSTELFRTIEQEIKSLQHWFKQPIGDKQPITTSDIIESIFKLAKLPSDSAIDYNVFLCCHILHPRFDLASEISTNGIEAYANLSLGDSLATSSLVWSALGCPIIAEYVNTNLRQLSINEISRAIEQRITDLKAKGESDARIKYDGKISSMEAEISRLKIIMPLPKIDSQLDPLERQKVLDACAEIDAENVKGRINVLNKCHPDVAYNIGTNNPDLFLKVLKQCNNTEAASLLRQELFTKYGMPKIEKAIREIKAQKILESAQTFKNAFKVVDPKEIDKLNHDEQRLISQIKDALDSPDFFNTEIGSDIKNKAEAQIAKQLQIIKDILTLFSPEGYSLQLSNPLIIEGIKKLVAQANCDNKPLDEILTLFSQENDTACASAAACSAESESLIHSESELPIQKSDALFDIPDHQ